MQAEHPLVDKSRAGDREAFSRIISKYQTLICSIAYGVMGALGMVLGPIVGVLGGWFGYSMSIRSARSDRERSFIRRMTLTLMAGIGVFGAALTLLLWQGRELAARNPYFLVGGIALLTVGYTVGLLVLILYGNRSISRIRDEDGTRDRQPAEVAASMPKVLQQFQYPRLYESRARLLGLPLWECGPLAELRSAGFRLEEWPLAGRPQWEELPSHANLPSVASRQGCMSMTHQVEHSLPNVPSFALRKQRNFRRAKGDNRTAVSRTVLL